MGVNRMALQAVNGNGCIHMHTRNKGCGFTCTCSQQVSLQIVSVAYKKMTVAVASVVALYVMFFLILPLA